MVLSGCQNLARHYERLGRHPDAIAHAEAALALSLRLNVPSRIIVARETYGMMFEAAGRLDESMAEYQAALSIANAVEDRLEAAGVLLHISALYYRKEEWSEALRTADDALPTIQSSGATKDYAVLFSQKGAALSKLGRHMEALQCYHSVLLAGKQLNDRALQILALSSIGTLRFKTGNYWGAVEAYAQTVQMASGSANALAEATAHSNIADVFLSLFEFDLAIFHEVEASRLYGVLGESARKDTSLFNLTTAYMELARVQLTLD